MVTPYLKDIFFNIIVGGSIITGQAPCKYRSVCRRKHTYERRDDGVTVNQTLPLDLREY